MSPKIWFFKDPVKAVVTGSEGGTLPSPDTELEEFTVTPNEAVLKELEADPEPLDNSFEIICIRTSNHVEPDEEDM